MYPFRRLTSGRKSPSAAAMLSRTDTKKNRPGRFFFAAVFRVSAVFGEKPLDKRSVPRYNTPVSHVNDS